MISKLTTKHKNVLSLISVIILFIVVSYLVNKNIDLIVYFIGKNNVLGIFVYIFLTVIETVVAPFSVILLIPIAVAAWGVAISTILNIIGWTIGSVLAYWIAQKFGRPIVEKFVDISKLDKMNVKIPEKNMFFMLTGLRMIFPVDILSYFLGLTVKIPFKIFFWSALIGFTPFAFILSYSSSLTLKYQVIIGIFGVLIFLYIYNRLRKYWFSG